MLRLKKIVVPKSVFTQQPVNEIHTAKLLIGTRPLLTVHQRRITEDGDNYIVDFVDTDNGAEFDPNWVLFHDFCVSLTTSGETANFILNTNKALSENDAAIMSRSGELKTLYPYRTIDIVKWDGSVNAIYFDNATCGHLYGSFQ